MLDRRDELAKALFAESKRLMHDDTSAINDIGPWDTVVTAEYTRNLIVWIFDKRKGETELLVRLANSARRLSSRDREYRYALTKTLPNFTLNPRKFLKTWRAPCRPDGDNNDTCSLRVGAYNSAILVNGTESRRGSSDKVFVRMRGRSTESRPFYYDFTMSAPVRTHGGDKHGSNSDNQKTRPEVHVFQPPRPHTVRWAGIRAMPRSHHISVE
jgi:hypothetical protein